MVEAVSARTGNVITFKVYKRKTLLFCSWWSFMCNEYSADSAETLIKDLRLINKGEINND